jgi:hypothetical protein
VLTALSLGRGVEEVDRENLRTAMLAEMKFSMIVAPPCGWSCSRRSKSGRKKGGLTILTSESRSAR